MATEWAYRTADGVVHPTASRTMAERLADMKTLAGDPVRPGAKAVCREVGEWTDASLFDRFLEEPDRKSPEQIKYERWAANHEIVRAGRCTDCDEWTRRASDNTLIIWHRPGCPSDPKKEKSNG